MSIMLPKMTATDFGKNAFRTKEFENAYPGDRRPQGSGNAPAVDSAEDVAKKILEQIISEAPEAEM